MSERYTSEPDTKETVVQERSGVNGVIAGAGILTLGVAMGYLASRDGDGPATEADVQAALRQNPTPIVEQTQVVDDGMFTTEPLARGGEESELYLEEEVNLDGGEGSIILNPNLERSDIQPLPVNPNNPAAADFQKFLNAPTVSSNGESIPPLAGYSYGFNDVSYSADNSEIEPQLPAYAWTVMTGERVFVPEIGEVNGEGGIAAAVFILNRNGRVHAWSENNVEITHGFFGTGPIWDGQSNMDITAQRLMEHYSLVLSGRHPDSGFTGQCDDGDNNCSGMNFVLVDTVDNGQGGFVFRYIDSGRINFDN